MCLLELQLKRTKHAALHISISADPRNSYGQPFMHTLLPHMHRSAYLKAPLHILALTPLPANCDRLACLEADYTKDWDQDEEDP